LRSNVGSAAPAKPSAQQTSSGLERAIVELIRHLEADTLADTRIDVHAQWSADLERDEQRHVIHILAELFSNIAHHGHATEVVVACSREPNGEMVIEIIDDGVGFDPEEVHPGKGLTTIHQHAGKLGGIVGWRRGSREE